MNTKFIICSVKYNNGGLDIYTQGVLYHLRKSSEMVELLIISINIVNEFDHIGFVFVFWGLAIITNAVPSWLISNDCTEFGGLNVAKKRECP